MVADSLLKQLYHWVSNPGSAAHHPLLHKALLGLMQRLFVVLVEEMKRLGATVVAANFNTVLIYTGRRNLTAAGKADRHANSPLTGVSWAAICKWCHAYLLLGKAGTNCACRFTCWRAACRADKYTDAAAAA